jgi:translation initiation factor IF-3
LSEGRDEGRGHKRSQQQHRTNEQITAQSVRLVGDDGQTKLASIDEALRMAAAAGVDLVEVAPGSHGEPPVCKLLSYGKFVYESSKRTSKLKKKQKVTKIKEVKLRPTIGDSDYMVKANNARDFIKEGHRVKITLRLRGREMLFKNTAAETLERFRNDLSDVAKAEAPIKREGSQFHLLLAPIKGV